MILACKAAPNLDKQPKLKHTKAFYAFNLNTKKLNETPKFVIEDKSLEISQQEGGNLDLAGKRISKEKPFIE